MAMGCGAEAEMRQRVTRQAIGPALQDEELGFEGIEIGLDPEPGGVEFSVTRAGRQRQVELGPARRSAPGLVRGASARVEIVAVLMQVGEAEVRV
jgi:hypothetical protein